MGRCENGFDSQRKCQCDSMCKYYRSCCSDFEATCGMMSKETSVFKCLKSCHKSKWCRERCSLVSLPALSSWRHVCVCRRWRRRAVWRHHSILLSSHQGPAEAHTGARLRLRPQTAGWNHSGNDQTPSTDGYRNSENPWSADDTHFTDSPTSSSTGSPQHDRAPSDWCSSWDDHCSHHSRHHWSPRPRRRGLQREAFWLLHATKKWLHVCLQRWVPGNVIP